MTEPTGQRNDPDLVSLVQLADAFGLEQEVVLSLAGQTLTGTLIGSRAHHEEIAGLVQGEDPDGTLRADLAARFRKQAADDQEFGAASKLGDLDPEGPEGEDLRSMPGVDYLHLRGVSVAGGSDVGELPLWRGRIADVAGWSLRPR